VIDFERIVHVRDSWAIDEVAYSSQRQELRISFPQTKSVWLFSEVPPEVFVQLILSESIGEYFNKNIRAVYGSVRVFPAPEDSAKETQNGNW